MQEESTCRARTLQRKCPLCQRHPLLFALCCLLCAALRYSRDKVVAVHSREGRKQALTCTYSTQPNTMPQFKRDASGNYVDKEGRPIQRGSTHLYKDSSNRELRQRVSDAGKRVVGENRDDGRVGPGSGSSARTGRVGPGSGAHTATHRHSGTHIELLSTIKACASEGGNLFRELIPGGSSVYSTVYSTVMSPRTV